MNKYLVERFIPNAGQLSTQELKLIAQQILHVQEALEEQIQWLYSIVTADRIVCLYFAVDNSTIRVHSRRSGLPIQ
jgi:hypothetical protein